MNKKTSLSTAILIIILIGSGIYLFKYYASYGQAEQVRQEAKELFEKGIAAEKNAFVEQKKKPEVLPIRDKFKELLQTNEDIVSWLSIAGTPVDHPVVQSINNADYLVHDFYGNYNRAGTLFMDYRNNASDLDQNTIIYGHALKNGDMFGELKSFLEEDFAKKHATIQLETLYEDLEFEIFAAYETTTEFYYLENEFTSNQAYADFIKEIKKRSVIHPEVDFTTADYLLTLSTCNNTVSSTEKRMVVHGKLIKKEANSFNE